MDRGKEVNPNKAIRYLPFFYIAIVFFSIGIAIIITDVIGSPERDLFNATALVLEAGFAIAITWTVYIYSKKWKKQNDQAVKDIENLAKNLQILTEHVHNSIKKEEETKQEIIQDTSFLLNRKLDSTIRSLKRSLALYEYYKKESNAEKKENYLKSTILSFDNCHRRLDLKLDLLKLMEIYGRATARQYWNLLFDLQMGSNNFFFGETEDELPSFISHVDDCVTKSENLKKIIEPMASDVVKSRN